MTRWLPLESNPESYNAWSKSLGLNTSLYSFQEVWGLDPDLLSYVKQPVKAVLLLFPITKEYEIMRKEKDAEIERNGLGDNFEDVVFLKQTIANACGSFALLHALGNAGVELEDGPLTELFERCIGKTPLERAALVDTSDALDRVHAETASSGQTATPNLEVEVDLHFVTFVNHKGYLVELDGRRPSPVNHGKIEVGLLEDTVKVVKNIIEITQSIQFNLVTLSPTPSDDE